MKTHSFFCSSFTEIFDVDHFISVLNDEISIVKDLPSQYSWSTREYYATGIRATRIKTAPVHASANWYLENILPVLERYLVISFVLLKSPVACLPGSLSASLYSNRPNLFSHYGNSKFLLTQFFCFGKCLNLYPLQQLYKFH